jgi:hypothetical protein
MPRGRRIDIFATLRAQAGKALQQLEKQIDVARADLQKMVDQAESWRGLLGGAFGGAVKRGPGRPAGSGRKAARGGGGGRVSWDDVLASVPNRFGVEDIMKHPGAASKGRAQVYPALTRWETAGRVRRVSKGVYEKAAGGAAATGRRPGRPAKKTAGRRGRPPGAKTRAKRGRKKASAGSEAAS